MKPNSLDIIIVEWLDYLEILVIHKKEDFDSFISAHKLEEESIAGDWDVTNGLACMFKSEGIPFFVFIFSNPKTRIIVHECVHMAQSIMEEMDIPVNSNSEVLAYMTDFLFTKVKKIIHGDK